jgi:hypothetical protein
LAMRRQDGAEFSGEFDSNKCADRLEAALSMATSKLAP